MTNSALQGGPDPTRLSELVFINSSAKIREPTNRLSLINKHCSNIAVRQRHNTRTTNASAFPRKHRQKQAVGIERRPPRSHGRLLLDTTDGEPHSQEEHLETHRQRHVKDSERGHGTIWPHWRPNTGVQSPQTNAFNMLPIEAKGHIPMAYEFFFQKFAPRISRSSTCCQPNSTWGLISGFQAFIQVLLQDAMLFEQIMALALLMRSFDDIDTTRDTSPSLYHSKGPLKQLRQRLESGIDSDSTSDAVVMTIVGLATMTFLIRGSLDTVNIYLQALQRIVAVRGGYDKLGWNGTLALKVRGLGIWLAAAQRRSGPKSVIPAYPKHPFNPALCHKISRLPIGFHELALRGRCSLQFIDLVEEVTALSRSQVPDRGSAGAIVFAILGDYCWPTSNNATVKSLMASPLERVLTFTLLAYCHCLGGHSVPSVEVNLQAHIRTFPRNRDFYVLDKSEENALDWASLMLRATTESTSGAWTWAAQILYATTITTETKQRLLEEIFFKIPHATHGKPGTLGLATQEIAVG